ncbi:glycine cleavage system aminomethyltransferase GcvT [Sphingomonas sp. ID0503]|uniref:glycine cleavage system aminomethyltransferase GcvT n=1 Tax=Sphingomonas sp. ID0503 TaxID=3399691 RepID=UPI003AFB6D6F
MSETDDQGPQEPPQPLPLDTWHRDRGARMVPFAGYSMPIQYEGIIAEHNWTRSHAGLFDVSHMGQLAFSGETPDVDVAGALEALLPGNIKGIKPYRQKYSLLLDEEGGVLDDLMISHRGEEHGGDFYMVVNGATKWDDIAHLREHLPDDVVMNFMEDHALLALQGPEAGVALARLVPETAGLFFMECGPFRWEGHDIWVSRSGYTGEDGFEISLDAEIAEAFADALAALPEVKPIGLGARDSLRLEAGLPLYGHDLDTRVTPVGAGLTFAIPKRRREEGGFMGAARVLKELQMGAPARWVGFRIDGKAPAREGAHVFSGDLQIGTLTSGGFAPTLGAPIAAGWIATNFAEPGTAVEIEVRGRRLPATVSAMPFVPHNYHRRGAAK